MSREHGMRIPRRLPFLLFLLALCALLFMGLLSFAYRAVPWGEASMSDVSVDVAAARTAFLLDDPDVDVGGEGEIHVLLLGLDARKGASNPHCDAIHLFTLDVEEWTIHITSVPRGTYSYIPPGNYVATDYYLANACAYAGLEYGQAQIEKILGVKADYVVTVGFSQVLGIARIFDLPTTETLQFLRHRQSYAIGDPQRSHNQAVFMKDMLIAHLDRFRQDFGTPMFYAIFSMLNTDMEFGTARALLNGYLKAEIDAHPERITLAMKPYYATVDYHFDPETSPEDLEKRLAYLEHLLSDDDLSNRSVEEIQAELVRYLEERLLGEEDVSDVFEQALWLQVEDDEAREDLHYRFVEEYAYQLALTDKEAALDLITDYIIEKEALGPEEYAVRARGLQNFLAQDEE